jgi:hypothetical protein
LVVFLKRGIIGEARLQSQAALQWNFIPRWAQAENIYICENTPAAYDFHTMPSLKFTPPPPTAPLA